MFKKWLGILLGVLLVLSSSNAAFAKGFSGGHSSFSSGSHSSFSSSGSHTYSSSSSMSSSGTYSSKSSGSYSSSSSGKTYQSGYKSASPNVTSGRTGSYGSYGNAYNTRPSSSWGSFFGGFALGSFMHGGFYHPFGGYYVGSGGYGYYDPTFGGIILDLLILTLFIFAIVWMIRGFTRRR